MSTMSFIGKFPFCVKEIEDIDDWIGPFTFEEIHFLYWKAKKMRLVSFSSSGDITGNFMFVGYPAPHPETVTHSWSASLSSTPPEVEASPDELVCGRRIGAGEDRILKYELLAEEGITKDLLLWSSEDPSVSVVGGVTVSSAPSYREWQFILRFNLIRPFEISSVYPLARDGEDYYISGQLSGLSFQAGDLEGSDFTEVRATANPRNSSGAVHVGDYTLKLPTRDVVIPLYGRVAAYTPYADVDPDFEVVGASGTFTCDVTLEITDTFTYD